MYDYWFVQFDFPDANGKPYKSSGGEMVYNEQLKREIPKGWEVVEVKTIADIFNGSTPTTTNNEYYNGDIVWITPKDLSTQQEKFIYFGERNITIEGYNSCSTHLLPVNSVLMSSRAPIGLLAIARNELCTNQGFKSFVPKIPNIHTYLYYYLMQHIHQIEQLGAGTTFKEVSREEMLRYKIVVPSDDILQQFENKICPVNDLQFTNQTDTDALIKQRNELLPLLMNGQVNSHLSAETLYYYIITRK